MFVCLWLRKRKNLISELSVEREPNDLAGCGVFIAYASISGSDWVFNYSIDWLSEMKLKQNAHSISLHETKHGFGVFKRFHLIYRVKLKKIFRKRQTLLFTYYFISFYYILFLFLSTYKNVM